MHGLKTGAALAVNVCIALLISGCVSPQKDFATSSDASLRKVPPVTQGQFGTIEIEGFQVPLQEGDWVEIGTIDQTTDPNFPAKSHVLVSESGGVIDRIVIISRQSALGSKQFGEFASCLDSSNLASEVISYASATADCTYVRAVPWLGGGDFGKMLSDYGGERNAYVPLVTVGPRIALNLAPNERIAKDYCFNPDLIAPNPNGDAWRPEDWAAGSAAGLSQVEVIKAMQSFGATVRSQIKQGNSVVS
ncbi:hypothetical protein G5B40_20275 [Pikeienuella piscinae]|uniref:Uncharacterized protein n=1 Tax=Pikeienuella piscinae TaxID=2748098 RepID=A0A7M3T6E7_9RHOB|nr:hypothetical protein [Pikeienuella piscinae]QIE57578.1 hypothetical protein G5B40_20275 [Pikeienuella piscinae]